MQKLKIELDVASEVLSEKFKIEFVDTVRKHAVLDLLRGKRITQSRAAELLGISRAELFDLMADADVAHVNLRPEQIRQDALRIAGHHRSKRV